LAQDKVELRADARAWEILAPGGQDLSKLAENSWAGRWRGVVRAAPEDYDQEWLSLILGVKVVDDIDEAIAHIQAHGTFHSDGILSNDWSHVTRFVNEVDSAAVFVNASTRFNDGGELGLGAEVAVSTQKLHARGPMGLAELTTYKWVVVGKMHVRK
jgi:glutamate-5-semialdehyde dehydrogenase